MQTRKFGMQVVAAMLLHQFTDLLHPKPQASKATVTSTMHIFKVMFFLKSVCLVGCSP
jgi:hypothetical protein